MPLKIVLTCARCGAYLPDMQPGAHRVVCPVCGTVTAVALDHEDALLMDDAIAVETTAGDGYAIAEPGWAAGALVIKLAPFLTTENHTGLVGRILAVEEARRMSASYLGDLMKQEDQGKRALEAQRAVSVLHRRNWLVAAAVALALALWYGLWLAAGAVAVGGAWLWLHYRDTLARIKVDQEILDRNSKASQQTVAAQIRRMESQLAELRAQGTASP